ncbi:hypothetical protein GLOTRDRAFT_101127 [Gloeophyllum trabeum ATCC 11539]|uniref:Uncharacterized protein n=1 Tax=Gloeophyllum trabeum (strain ATCC 11539 / FP-39264 / Madison 617) TaxID=670483 RepID=S7PZ13_GLOTA|nr:uncharacterized protein GLOTRDRAFT_101127 [Gloeophyllum trabeum ATCC 11539]EPQ52886.1 hypothetical protein GLOTRDRAFT_101127 [Gloeophyllum trabeum ATCC 11539]
MTVLTSVLGFSLFGLAARMGQLGIQKRNLMSNPAGHLIAMGVFGYAGYWAHVWEERSTALIAEKQAQIAERRAKLAAAQSADS